MKRKSPSKGFFFFFSFLAWKKELKKMSFLFGLSSFQLYLDWIILTAKLLALTPSSSMFCLHAFMKRNCHYSITSSSVWGQPCNNKYFDIRSPNSTVSSTDLWLIASLMCSCSFADRPQHVFLVLFWFPPQANQTRLGSWRLLMAENRHSWHGVSLTLNRNQKALPITAQLQKKMFMDIDRFICF